MKKMLLLTLLVSSSICFANSKVYFVTPKNNEAVAQTFPVEFAVEGMSAVKAGEIKANTGHHHIIVDGGSVDKDVVIPKDEMHKHFGDGSSKTTLTLKPGKHTLTLQFADGAHKSYGKEMSETISIEVK